MKDDHFVHICAALVIAIGGIIAYTSSSDGDQKVEQQEPEHHAARKHHEDAACKPMPCVDPPLACFMHGGAPTAPECLRD